MLRKAVLPGCLLVATAVCFITVIDPASSAGRRGDGRGGGEGRTGPVARAVDPGVRGNPVGAGHPLPGLTANQLRYFRAALEEFVEVESVADDGLGPTFNAKSCVACHMQPAVGGSSPPVNPQVALGNAWNVIPSFIRVDGPVREVRFVRNPDGTPDGGVHALFTVAGRYDGCYLRQPDFAGEMARGNVVFRIPTPTFGGGLMEQIPDSAILANQAKDAPRKRNLGIRGRPNIVLAGSTISGQPNRNGNDGTLARFGWKAQNKSLLMFSGEAYNVEMGISNELFQTERDETEACHPADIPIPNDSTNTDATDPVEALSGIEHFALFMRFLAAPTPSADTPGGAESIANGSALFEKVGCSLCHTPMLKTGSHAAVKALNDREVHLYSDLLVHDMGPGLADGITQGQAGPREWRTAPLWGLGQRLFFLHDGRTADLVEAIQEHKSGSSRSRDASEANAVVDRYNALAESDKQDILNFLRSL